MARSLSVKSAALFFCQSLHLLSKIEIVLSYPARRVCAKRAHYLRVADIQVRVVVRSFRGFRDRGHEIDSGHKRPELISLRDHIATPAPARQVSELTLNCNVG